MILKQLTGSTFSCVGAAVGCIVGDGVCLIDGSREGLNVGSAVGSNVGCKTRHKRKVRVYSKTDRKHKRQ
jgi:hypothetical protein